MTPTVAILVAKTFLDFGVCVFEYIKGNYPQSFLFFTFMLVDIASIGVLVK